MHDAHGQAGRLPVPFEDPDVTGGLNQDSITICYSVEWPAPYLWNSKRPIDRGKWGPPSWMGSLVEGGRDPSGQMYMRNRYYDPTTGRFTQEDPIRLAGGINLYRYANGDAVNFSDPFGLCPVELDGIPCVVYSTGADLTKLRPEAMTALRELAENSGHHLGVSAGIEGTHNDIRHNGKSAANPTRNNARYSGLAVDINEIDGVDIGTVDQRTAQMAPEVGTRVDEVTGAARLMADVRAVIAPIGYYASTKHGDEKTARPFSKTRGVGRQHQNHLHVTFYADFEKGDREQ